MQSSRNFSLISALKRFHVPLYTTNRIFSQYLQDLCLLTRIWKREGLAHGNTYKHNITQRATTIDIYVFIIVIIILKSNKCNLIIILILLLYCVLNNIYSLNYVIMMIINSIYIYMNNKTTTKTNKELRLIIDCLCMCSPVRDYRQDRLIHTHTYQQTNRQ